VGTTALMAGKVTEFRGRLQLTNPEVHAVGDGDDDAVDAFAGALMPIYPATASVSSLSIVKCVQLVLDSLGPIADPLPPTLRMRHGLPGLQDAYRAVHIPTSRDDVARGAAG